MGLFDKLFKKEEVVELPKFDDCDVVAVATGEFIPAEKISDVVFAQEMLGQTVAIEPTEGTMVAPCNGTLEVLFPTGHAYAVRRPDGAGILVHVGIDTVNMKGKGFKILAKKGDTVVAGQPIVKVDLKAVKAEGHPTTTMVIVTDKPTDDYRVDYVEFGPVTKATKISK